MQINKIKKISNLLYKQINIKIFIKKLSQKKIVF